MPCKSPEARREWTRNYRLKNRERLLAQNRERAKTHREEHHAKGLCSEISCSREARKGFKLCVPCLEERRQRRDKLISFGLCRKCLINKASPKMKSCDSCRDSTNADSLMRKILIAFVYGGECACDRCSETNIHFLTLDHMDNNGAQHRKQSRSNLWTWAWTNNFPQTLRLLCWNCNCARATNNGMCPHFS